MSSIDREIEISKAREQVVVKDNEFIQKAKYNLTVNQQKLIAYVISLIKPTDQDLMMYELSVADFCELIGIEKKYFYREFEDILIDLDKKSFLVETKEKVFNFRWFSEFEYLKGKAKVRLQLNSNIKQYLVQLSEKYTQYELYNILALKGKYSIRFYELFKSWSYRDTSYTKEIALEELKSMLLCENYKQYKAFRRRVLEPSIDEINEFTDLDIELCEPIYKGRKVIGIKFRVKHKETLSKYAAYCKTIDQINRNNKQIKGQMSLFDIGEEDFYRVDTHRKLKITMASGAMLTIDQRGGVEQ